MASNLELYRRSKIGMALTDALDDMITTGELTPILAMKVLAEFDKSIANELKNVNYKVSITGKLHTYRFCDNVWTFLLEDACLKSSGPNSDTSVLKVASMKIVACDSKILSEGM